MLLQRGSLHESDSLAYDDPFHFHLQVQPRHDAHLQPVPELRVLLVVWRFCLVLCQPPAVHRPIADAVHDNPVACRALPTRKLQVSKAYNPLNVNDSRHV